MKLTMILLVAAWLHVSATGFGQKVSISGKDLPLEKVFSIIKKQTSYVFFYDYSIFQGARNVSLDVKNAEIGDVLRICFQDQDLDFSITNKTISIIKKEEKTEIAGPGPGKSIKAQGVVLTEGGQPLSGANVTIKETGHGTITNVKGEFTLSEAPANGTLVISFIGYAPQKVKIKEGTALQVYLTVAKNELDKVVVQAYGNTTERLNTGNISTVSAAEIEKQPVANVLTALQGKVPGLVVQQTSGYASAPFKVELRGRAQIDGTLPSEPLYIIDGVPLTILQNPNGGGNYQTGSVGFTQNGIVGPANGQSPFFSINPNDIESISVLKDADATAIYGSRGANGVILINTKKGKAGKTKLDLNVYQGISQVTRRYSMLNTQQYLAMRHEAFNNDGITPNPGNAYDLLTWDTTRYTDWQKYLWGGTGKTTDLTLSLSGGDKQTTFRIGGTYHRETDILTVSGASQRASVQFNLSHKSLDQRLGISFTNTYSYSYVNLIGTLGGPAALAPDAPSVFTKQGQLNWAGWVPISNPFSLLLQPYTAKTGFLNSQLSLSYELLKNLNFEVDLGYSTSHQSQLDITPIIAQNPLYSPRGSALFGNNNNSNAIVEPQLHYKTFISKGKLEALVGGSVQSVSQDGNGIEGDGYTDDNLLRSISNAPTRTAIDNTAQYKYGAFFTRLNYNWENRFLLNLSARRDGSSRFGPGRQFGNFGAVGAAWIFTEEDWARKSLSFLSFGKLRGSYGLTGSDNLPNYQYLSSWSGSTAIPYYQNTNVYIPLIHANPNLQWQVNKKAEAALDLGFLADRITFELAWYQNLCSNQLVAEPLSIITGFNQVTANLPATVRNRGWESSFRAKIIDSKTFGWSVNGNIGINRNKLIAFPGLSQSPYASVYLVGQSLNIKKLLHYTGIDPQTGQYMVQDKNHDGNININANDTANDFYNKDLSLKYEGGFGTDFRYKNWQLSLFFRFRKQELPGNIASIGTPGGIQNYPTDILNRWQKPGDKAEYARFTTQPNASDQYFYSFSDGIYSDGSYIRLQNLSLTYTLPASWLNKASIRDAKVFFHAENLFLITKYKGLDPDTPGYGAMPPAKILVGGLQFNF